MTHSPHTPIIVFNEGSTDRYVLGAGYKFLAWVARAKAREVGAAVFIGTGAGPELRVRTHGVIEPIGDAVNVSPVLQPLLREPIDHEATILYRGLAREHGRTVGPPRTHITHPRRPATNGRPGFTVTDHTVTRKN